MKSSDHGRKLTNQLNATWMQALLVLASCLAPNSSQAWDAAPSDFLILDPAATVSSAKAAAAAGKLAFDEGVALRFGCYYKYQSGIDTPAPWRIEFSVDGKPLGSVPAQGPKIGTFTKSETYVSPSGIQSETTTSEKLVDKTYYAEVKWTASGDGPRTVQCLLNPDKVPGEINLDNNLAQRTIVVRRIKALSGDELPPVELMIAAARSAFAMEPELRIALNATVSAQATGGKANVIQYAKASPFEQTWHIEILRRGTGGLGGFESKIGEFVGPLKGFQFNAQLNHAWLQQRNASVGKYAARAYLAQTANGATVTGPNSRVEFELQEATQRESLQSGTRSGSPPQDSAGRAAVIEQMQRTPASRAQASTDSRSRTLPQDQATREEMIRRPLSVQTPEPAPRGAPARGSAPLSEAPRRDARAAPGQAVQMEIEAESLAKSGAIQVAGGQAQGQGMGAFGSGWSGGEQLFWRGGAVGAVLDLIIEVPVAAKYAIEIYMSRAPDYGQLRFEIDGKASATPFDGMAPKVMAAGPTQLGTFPLQAGARRVSLMITGKHAQSSGYFVGIDKLRLYPAGPIN